MNNNNDTIPKDFISWSYITPLSTMPTANVLVFWLIFVVTLLLLILKSIKYIVKWKNKKISTSDAIEHLNVLVGDMMKLLSANRGQLAVAV